MPLCWPDVKSSPGIQMLQRDIIIFLYAAIDTHWFSWYKSQTVGHMFFSLPLCSSFSVFVSSSRCCSQESFRCSLTFTEASSSAVLILQTFYDIMFPVSTWQNVFYISVISLYLLQMKTAVSNLSCISGAFRTLLKECEASWFFGSSWGFCVRVT